MSSDVIIRARHLAKAYKLYDSPGDWVKQQLLGSPLLGSSRMYYKSFWALKDITFEVERGESSASSAAMAAASPPSCRSSAA